MTDLKKLEEEIATLQKEADELSNAIASKKNELMPKTFRQAYEKLAISYSQGGSRQTLYFDWDSGAPLSDVEGYALLQVSTLKGKVEVFTGYDVENGMFLVSTYNYSINNTSMKMKKKLIMQRLVSWDHLTRLNSSVKLNGTKDPVANFLCEFFDCEFNCPVNLDKFSRVVKIESNMETILRSDLSDYAKSFLLERNAYNGQKTEVQPLNKLIGLNRKTYALLIEKGLLDEYVATYITNNIHCSYVRKPLFVPKSDNELIEILEYCRDKEEELKKLGIGFSYRRGYGLFYSEDDDIRLFYNIVSSEYNTYDVFSKNYSFIKLLKYVGEEVVNQGYNMVTDFLNLLKDYLQMCQDAEVKPLLYSSYLEQNHDLASRNLKIVLEEKQEEKFVSRYEGYKDMKIGDYFVVCPKSSNDLKVEGSNLGHCVASYINKVINGGSLIFFLRKEADKSLVTFEYDKRENNIVQQRGARNRATTQKEAQAINAWLEEINNN